MISKDKTENGGVLVTGGIFYRAQKYFHLDTIHNRELQFGDVSQMKLPNFCILWAKNSKNSNMVYFCPKRNI